MVTHMDNKEVLKNKAGVRTIGEAIDEEVKEIIEMVGWERKPDHPFYGKSDAELAELFLVDQWNKIFKAQKVTRLVKKHFGIKED